MQQLSFRFGWCLGHGNRFPGSEKLHEITLVCIAPVDVKVEKSYEETIRYLFYVGWKRYEDIT